MLKPRSFAVLVVDTEELICHLDVVLAAVTNLHESVRTPLVDDMYAMVSREYTTIIESIWKHQLFYKAHVAFRMTNAYKRLDDEEQIAFATQFSRFKQFGVFLSDAMKLRIARYEKELELLEEQFAANLTNSHAYPAFHITDSVQLSGVNESAVLSMRAEAVARKIDGCVALAAWSHRGPILSGADYRPLREAVYRAHEVSASDIGAGGTSLDNRPVAERILLVRERLANVNGFKSCAHHTIESHMSRSPKVVRNFLNSMIDPVVRVAKHDFARLDRFARMELGHSLEPWDLEYVRNRYIKKEYGYTGADLRPYLSLHAVLKVLFRLVKEQYGCRIVEKENPSAWHSCVRFFEVYENSGQLVGGFYLDAYARSGREDKNAEHYWVRGIVNRRRVRSGDIVVPTCVVHLNFLGDGDSRNTKMSHQELATLFHEFGHALEYLFDRAHFQATGLVNREADVVEVASLFMENWAWDIEVLAEIIGVGKRRGQIPLRMLLAIHRQRSLIESLGRWSHLDYLMHGLVDLELHTQKARKGLIREVVQVVKTKLKLPLQLQTSENRYPNNYLLFFTLGYAASTYSYLWSWKFAAAIKAVHLRGPRSINPIVSRRFRREFIESASVRPVGVNLRAFFGANLPSAKALLEYSRRI